MITDKYISFCDKKLTIIKIPNDVAISPNILDTIKTFSEKNYKFALSYANQKENIESLIKYIQYIKLDISQFNKEILKNLIQLWRDV